ncbi:MAG TPA: hypothetical protein VM326_03280 [Sphingomicrobium sp.]|jgi:hypothetical protein|nr:hypothetical protein [Sphingomicrobium sp.]
MKSSVIGAAIVGAAIWTASAPALAQGTCAVAGRYWALGRNAGGVGSYQGEVLISPTSSGCHVQWFAPNESAGTGTYNAGVLTVNFTFQKGAGGSGVVRYTRAANGEMHGVWWMNGYEHVQGTETLRPM